MRMQQVVSITSQGQLTIPKEIRESFGITGAVKAVIRKQGNSIIVSPRDDFWALSGSLSSEVTASDEQLKKVRQNFSKQWGKQWK